MDEVMPEEDVDEKFKEEFLEIVMHVVLQRVGE